MAKNPRTPTEHELTQFRKWRSIALFHMPYIASILFSLRLVSVDGLGTLAVDKNMRLYIDFPAVEADYTDDENGQNLLHEASHVFADHASVRDEIGVTVDQAMTFNVAADAAINDDLVAAGLDSFATSGIMPSQFGEPDHQTAQFYFRSLMERIEDQKPEEAEGGDDTDESDNDSGDTGTGQPGDSSNGEGDQSDGDRDDEATRVFFHRPNSGAETQAKKTPSQTVKNPSKSMGLKKTARAVTTASIMYGSIRSILKVATNAAHGVMMIAAGKNRTNQSQGPSMSMLLSK